MESNYFVIVEGFAERHFIKNFEKKHKSHWAPTLDSLLTQFQFVDNLLATDKADLIAGKDFTKIVKTEFKVFGTKESAKSSGNRCIVAVHDDVKLVKVLLVYAKTDIPKNNETAGWKRIIKENYPEYKDMLLLI